MLCFICESRGALGTGKSNQFPNQTEQNVKAKVRDKNFGNTLVVKIVDKSLLIHEDCLKLLSDCRCLINKNKIEAKI